MKLRELIKKKLPATFNAAEYETERVLNAIEQLKENYETLFETVRRVTESQKNNQNALQQHIEEIKWLEQDYKDLLGIVRQIFESQKINRDALQQSVGCLTSIVQEAEQDCIERTRVLMKETNSSTIQALDRWERRQQNLVQKGEQILGTLSLQECRRFRSQVKPTLYLELHVAEQCNLNCRMCSHFSCLAEPELLSPEDFERDMKRLAELFDNGVEQIKLLGGEPLLNPDLPELCRIARHYFPDNKLFVLTNGILLPQMPEDFWATCRSEKVTVLCSEYPIAFDYQGAAELAQEKAVIYQRVTYERDEQGAKVFHHLPLDLTGQQNPVASYQDCFQANSGTVTLYHGRLFTCTVAANARHFKRYFSSDILLSSRDSIDIHEAKSAWEIMEFLARPIPFCRYCDVKHRTFNHTWGTTKKDIREWTLPCIEER